MRVLGLLVCAMPLFAACGDDVEQSASGVFPSSGFLGREVRVEVNGDNTSFGAGTTVSFGAGVTVDAVEVSSPTVLFATLTIDPTAAAGFNDVTVTDGGSTLTMTGAFELRNPVEVNLLDPVPQGGFGTVLIENKDLENLFDTRTDQFGDFLATATAGAGVTVSVVDVTEFSMTLSVVTDVDAASGPLTIVSDGLTSPAGDLEITPRTAQPLTAGTPATLTTDPAGNLFEVTAATADLLHLEIGTNDPNGNPGFVVLPASGKFADALGGHAVDNRLPAAGDKYYLIVTDFGGFFSPPTFGYQASLLASTVSLTGVTPVADIANNNTSAVAQQLTGPIAHFQGALADTNDSDFVKITLGATDRIRVHVTDADVFTDTMVSIFEADGTTPLVDDFGDDIVDHDFDFGEDVSAASTGAGTYFVQITASTFGGYMPANDPYDLVIEVVPGN